MEGEATKTAMLASRRSFLKGAAAVAVAAGGAASAGSMAASLVPLEAKAAPSQDEEKVFSFCRCNCGDAGCALELTVRDGNITFVQPQRFPDATDAEKGRTRGCMRGVSNFQRFYSDERVQRPLRRTGERGSGQWGEISWDEAIKEVSEKWADYRKQYGGESVAIWTSFGSFGDLNGAFGACWSRLAYFTGSSSIMVGSDWSNMYTAPFHLGVLFFGSSNSLIPGNTKNFIAWGENTAECYHHTWRYIAEAQLSGTQMTVIDPRVTITAKKADAHFRPRPGSDGALALGIAKYYFDEELYDADFIREHTDGVLLVRADNGMYLTAADAGLAPAPEGEDASDQYVVWDDRAGAAAIAGEESSAALFGTHTVNGIRCTTVLDLFKERADEWPLDRASEVCGLSEDDIVKIGDTILDGPTTIKTGFGYGHMMNSHSTTSAIICLMLMAGQMGFPGAGYGFYMSDERFAMNNDYGYPEASGVVTSTTGAVSGGGENARGPQYSVLKLPEIMETGKYGGDPAPLKMAVAHATNAIANTPNRQALLAAVNKLEYFVAVDAFMTETASYADMVLPAAGWFEEPDHIKPSRQHYLEWGPAAIDPLYESKSDFEICKLIGCAMGFEDQYRDEEMDVLKDMVDLSGTVDADGKKVTFARLQEEGEIRLAYDDGYNSLDEIGTTTGRLQFYIEQPAPRVPWGEELDERDHMAYFEPPVEAWPETVDSFPASEQAAKYPLIFFSFHQKWRVHTTFGNAMWLRELSPEPVMSINPEDAAARGIAEGDMVRAFNDRGYVVVRARLDAAMKPGTLNLPHGWQRDDFVEGHYADLSSNVSNVWDANENYYDVLCEVEKYEVR